MWRPTSTTGRSVKYCTKPISALGQLDGSSRPRGRTRGCGAPVARSANSSPTRQADEQEHQVGVELAELAAGRARCAAASASPACGPEPVTTVPSVEHQPRPTPNVAQASATRSATDVGGRAGGWSSREQEAAPRAPMIASEHEQVERHDPRVQVGQHGDPAEHRLGRDARARAAARAAAGRAAPSCQAATKVATATAASTKVSVRLPNSIGRWTSSAPCGVNDRSVHRGQVGQPSPEPVSRTAPPVTTMHDVGDQGGPGRAGAASGRCRRGSAASLPRERPRGQDGADERPTRAARPARARRCRRRSARCACASPSAPEGSSAATCPKAPYAERGQHDGAAGQQQQVDQVGRGQRRLGAQHAGHEQPERGEGRGAERRPRAAPTEGTASSAGSQPSASADRRRSPRAAAPRPAAGRRPCRAAGPERGSGEEPSRLITP